MSEIVDEFAWDARPLLLDLYCKAGGALPPAYTRHIGGYLMKALEGGE